MLQNTVKLMLKLMILMFLPIVQYHYLELVIRQGVRFWSFTYVGGNTVYVQFN